MNQEEYRKLAIARSVERARMEAQNKKEEQNGFSSNHAKPHEKTQNTQSKVDSVGGNKRGDGRNLSDLKRQFESLAKNGQAQKIGGRDEHGGGVKKKDSNVQSSKHHQGHSAGVNGSKTSHPAGVNGAKTNQQPRQRSSVASRPNALRTERKVASTIDKSLVKRPSALEPLKIERAKGVGVNRGNDDFVHASKRESVHQHQPKHQPVQTQQPKYRVVSEFTGGREQKIVEKVATPKASTIINSSKTQTSTTSLRERQKGSDMMNSIPNDQRMKVIFLGGIGEIGKNITAVEYMDEILVIDCGISFPSLDMPGIDLVIPDTTYLKQNASKVKAFLITHGHEDHIGALPYVMRDVKAPIYSGKLTLALIENKLKEHQLENIHMQVVAPRREYKIGGFNVEFVDVNHSIPDSYAIKVSTKAGTLFHTGDFKIDFQPIDGRMIDLPRIAEIGNEGVDLLLCESTNIEFEGYTLSESTVGEKLDDIFEENKTRRMFVATFSSNIYRVQQILELAQKYNRKVALIGRSMMKNLEAAIKVEKLNFPKSLFVDVEKSNKFEDNEILILCTGSQGESNAALSRLASGEYTKIEIGSNDTVIFSSSPIPGNESNINRVINNLYKKGAIVVHENVHASGHACIEEIKTIHSLIKPRFFVPVHGEYRHLKKHALLAENIMHMNPSQIIIPELGDVLEITSTIAKVSDRVQAGEVLVDGYGLGDVSSSVLRERKLLAEEGLVVVVIGIDGATNRLLSKPIVITRGFVYDEEEDVIVEEAKQIIVGEIEKILGDKNMDWEEAKQIIRKPLRNYFLKKTKRSPIILPVVHKVNINNQG